MPKVSVIMPAYNGEKYIKTAVDSILNQSFTDFELIIINDASTDATEDILLSYGDERIVYLKNGKNLGVAGTLNRGLSVACGEYVARMDADDISEPERLEQQVAYMDAHPDTVVCGTDVTIFGEGMEPQMGSFPKGDGKIKTTLLFVSPFVHPSVMVRTAALRGGGFCYEEDYEKVEDYRLWIRLSHVGAFANLPQRLLRYRVHPGQVTAVSSQAQHEGRLRLAAELLPKLGVDTEQEQQVIVAAFDGHITHEEAFRKFENLALLMLQKVPKELDKAQLRLLLKSRTIELARGLGVGLKLKTIGLVGIKAWIYVNLGVGK